MKIGFIGLIRPLEEYLELRVFTSRWLGDDARIKFRECGMDLASSSGCRVAI